MTISNSQSIKIGSTVRLTGNYRPLDAQVRLGISQLTGIVEYVSGVNHSNVGVRFSNGQFFNCQLSELSEVQISDQAGEPAQPSLVSPVHVHIQEAATIDTGSRVKVKRAFSRAWGKVPKFAGKVGTVNYQIPISVPLSNRYGFFFSVALDSGQFETYYSSDLELVQPSTLLNADEVVQPYCDSSLSRDVATYSQTLLDGVYDVVASGVAKVKAKFSKRVDDSPPPVQATLFEYLKPYAKEQYLKMLALFRSYSKDLEELNNPLSRLSKMLGRKRDAMLDSLAGKVPVMARDLTAYGLMWEVL